MNDILNLETAPDTVEFGGLVWGLCKWGNDSVEYAAVQPGVGQVRVCQYPEDGRWYARNSLDLLVSGDLRPVVMEPGVSKILDTMEEGMQFCLDARSLAIEDLKKMFRGLGVGDPYGVGFRDGQASIREKIAEVLS